MSFTTHRLLELDIFQLRTDSLTTDERTRLAYQRAPEIARLYGENFKVDDVRYLTPKFWRYHQDLINPFDMAAFTLITIQYNLCAGTLAPFLPDRPDLGELMKRILNFDVSAQFLLTEVGHGLDARNVETTATLLPDGDFELHTPHQDAAKYMPPTSPQPGFPRVGIVMARLLVDNEERGVCPFLVWLNNGYQMGRGIHIKVLPRQAGSKRLDHSITMFDHVRIPGSAILGGVREMVDLRADFHLTIWRVHIGTLALSTTLIPVLKRAVFVAGKYSQRRTVGGPDGKRRPIISFRTQLRPILHTIAQIIVFECYAWESIKVFMDAAVDYRVRHGIAAAFKAVLTQATQSSLSALAERCGAQGLFEYNNIIDSQLEARGISIAEGDTLALSIRLASELLIRRYSMPAPKDPSCALARYEWGMFDLCSKAMERLSGDHRSEEYNKHILPHCQALVEAIGHRMAYEAAREAGIAEDVLALYEACVLRNLPAWYVGKIGLNIKSQFGNEVQAMDSISLRLDSLLDATGAEKYCTAPIVKDGSWGAFVDSLQANDGEDSASAHSQARFKSKL